MFFIPAFEILGNVTKRRAYDSVDPEINDDIPEVDEDSKSNFFEVFTEVFERNERYLLWIGLLICHVTVVISFKERFSPSLTPPSVPLPLCCLFIQHKEVWLEQKQLRIIVPGQNWKRIK